MCSLAYQLSMKQLVGWMNGDWCGQGGGGRVSSEALRCESSVPGLLENLNCHKISQRLPFKRDDDR